MKPHAERPRITVLMAVHDGLQYLPDAVNSILRQTFTDFEFIIINDGSTDGSGTWLESLTDPRIRIVQQDNLGLTKSLNRGLSMARGEFIARMDADDVSLPGRLERQLQEFQADAELVLLGSEVMMTSADGDPAGKRGHALEHAEIRRQLLMGMGGALTHPVVMYPLSAIKQIGLYDERFRTVQDLDLYLRLSEVGKMRNLPETLLYWRQHSSSVNHTQSDSWVAMQRMAIEHTIERIGPSRFAKELFPDLLTDLYPCGIRRQQAKAEHSQTLTPRRVTRVQTATRQMLSRCYRPFKSVWERFSLVPQR